MVVPSSQHAKPESNPIRILLLEDSSPVRHLMQVRLQKAGYTVEAVTNGHQGFHLATSNAYDAIVSDIHMPHWDGFQFIEAIQAICPQLPIILVTATHADMATSSRLHGLTNVLAVLPKPVDFDLLFTHLQSVTSQHYPKINKMARIVCTIGPACNATETLGKMILAGMDVARLNFSHGNHDQHEQTLAAIREAEQTWDKPIAVLQDLCGPKIRTGAMQDGAITLEKGASLVIRKAAVLGTPEEISTINPTILQDLRRGDPILLDDGLLELQVTQPGRDAVTCAVIAGGILKSHKGINLPSTKLSLPSITQKDWQDIDWALAHSIDYVALSFVRTAEEIHQVKAYIKKAETRDIKVVAKIEKPEAVQHIQEIIQAADAVMIARGDMGVELPAAKIPRIQERIITLCREHNTPVITATQMLDSMTTNSKPSRAEVTDVSMAIKEGTDAVMLSQETATGVNPVNVVRTMSSIISEEERYTEPPAVQFKQLQQDASVKAALSGVAGIMDIAVVLLLDPEGQVYTSLSKWNRRIPILLVTNSVHRARHACLYNNIFPLIIKKELGHTELIKTALTKARERGYVKVGDQVACMEGHRTTQAGFQQIGAVRVIRVQ